MRVGVLASGSGTILAAVLERGDVPVVAVVVDRPCPAIDVAAGAGVPCILLERTDFSDAFDRDAYTRDVVATLEEHDVDLVAMAGFGTILAAPIHDRWPGRIVNTHPALLPAFKGWRAVEDALAAGVQVTGCTVHLATLAVDDGPILAQEAVGIRPDDTVATLHERIKEVERRLYPAVLARLVRQHGGGEAGVRTTITRALLSVWDKAGVVELGRALHDLGVELVSSSSTAQALSDAGLPVTPVDEVTGVPEMLDNRVKTLHPRIHGGLLADLGKEAHRADLAEHGIEPFGLVVSNLYPFEESPGIETIDIGGPAMVRAAAKNHEWVAVVTDPSQYAGVVTELQANEGTLGADTRRALALEAFARTAAYDAAVVAWLQEGEVLPRHLVLPFERAGEPLRYGENPHQSGARYRRRSSRSWWDDVVVHGGLALSYLNLYDAEAAWLLVHDLGALGDRPACVIVKHANPCGIAIADDLATAYGRALACDPRSAFGGVVACNRPVDDATLAAMVDGPQADVVIAPGYGPGTIDGLAAKRRNTRVLEAARPVRDPLDLKPISGGVLVQEAHRFAATRDDWRVVTKAAPTADQWRDLEFAWRVCGWVKSNAIVLARDLQAVGIGAGQQNRVEAGELAAAKAAGRAVGGACASDAFYPFPDGVEAAAAAGVAAVVQPGGALRDDDVVAAADELGLAMVFTGERHFLH